MTWKGLSVFVNCTRCQLKVSVSPFGRTLLNDTTIFHAPDLICSSTCWFIHTTNRRVQRNGSDSFVAKKIKLCFFVNPVWSVDYSHKTQNDSVLMERDRSLSSQLFHSALYNLFPLWVYQSLFSIQSQSMHVVWLYLWLCRWTGSYFQFWQEQKYILSAFEFSASLSSFVAAHSLSFSVA